MKAQLQALSISENLVLVPSELCFEAALAVTPRVADECDCMSSAIYDSVESVHEMYLVSILYKA